MSPKTVSHDPTESGKLDQELEATFPASDPPASTHPKGHRVKSTTDVRARAQADADRKARQRVKPR
jgi:hypothetical protein